MLSMTTRFSFDNSSITGCLPFCCIVPLLNIHYSKKFNGTIISLLLAEPEIDLPFHGHDFALLVEAPARLAIILT